MRRGNRSARAAVVLLAAIAATGCATKKDVRTLQDEMMVLSQRQDSLLRETQRQTQLLLDTLRGGFEVQRDLRGETSHRFGQLEQNLSRLEEMINQTQLVVAQLLERLDRPVMGPGPTGSTGAPMVPGAAEETYQQAMRFLGEESYATARMAFEQIVTNFPDDPRAADAQVGLAETYLGEGDIDRGLEELEKVERQWPRSPRAPGALLRAGIVALENDRRDDARSYFQQVLERYPSADEARIAEQRLRSIR
jgi:tol-pal system protein YbgF